MGSGQYIQGLHQPVTVLGELGLIHYIRHMKGSTVEKLTERNIIKGTLSQDSAVENVTQKLRTSHLVFINQ